MSQDDLNSLPDDINQLKELVLSMCAGFNLQNKTIEHNYKAIKESSKVIKENAKTIKDSQSEIVRLNEKLSYSKVRYLVKAVKSHPIKPNCLTK